MSTATTRVELEQWVRSDTLAGLVEQFGGSLPTELSLTALLAWLEEFSAQWDFRRGKERNLVDGASFGAARDAVILDAATSLGLRGSPGPTHIRYDEILILGGLVRACIARPLAAAKMLEEASLRAEHVTALGGYRPLKGDEFDLARQLGIDDLADEFDAMDIGLRRAFGVQAPDTDRGASSDVIGESWRVREYFAPAGARVRVIAAPSSEPGVRRANTPDTYAWFATDVAELAAGQRLLIVTSEIYVPFQHAAALRMLALPYAVEIETIGIDPGTIDSRLAQTFEPHNYLQEIRSAIMAMRELDAALQSCDAGSARDASPRSGGRQGEPCGK